MRIIFLLLLLHSFDLDAQTTTYTKVQFRLNCNYVYAMPLGQFSSGHNDRFYAGQCMPASGASFSMGVALPNHFGFGLHFSAADYSVNSNRFYAQLRDLYSKPGYYTTIDIKERMYSVMSSSLEGSYIFDFHFAEMEPYLLLGIGYADDIYGPIYTIHQKEKGSNYSEDISTHVDRRSFSLPAIGIRGNKKIWETVYASARIEYNYAISKYKMSDTKTDFLGNNSFSGRSYSQPVSALQVQAGVEVRFRAKRHLKPVPAK